MVSRASPSGIIMPNEIVRYSFPIQTVDAGKVSVPLWASPGDPLVDSATLAGLLTTPFLALPGRLDLASVSVVSTGNNTGSKISLQWQETTKLPPPTPAGAPVLDFVDPTQPLGVVTRQIDFKDVKIPDTGAAIAPYLTIPGNVVVNGLLYVYLSVAVFWKEKQLRAKLG